MNKYSSTCFLSSHRLWIHCHTPPSLPPWGRAVLHACKPHCSSSPSQPDPSPISEDVGECSSHRSATSHSRRRGWTSIHRDRKEQTFAQGFVTAFRAGVLAAWHTHHLHFYLPFQVHLLLATSYLLVINIIPLNPKCDSSNSSYQGHGLTRWHLWAAMA